VFDIRCVQSDFSKECQHTLFAANGLTELLQDFFSDRHDLGVLTIPFRSMTMRTTQLPDKGLYRFAIRGSRHAVSPELGAANAPLYQVSHRGKSRAFKELGQQREAVRVRDLLGDCPGNKPRPLGMKWKMTLPPGDASAPQAMSGLGANVNRSPTPL